MSTGRKLMLLGLIFYMMFLGAVSDNVRGILVPIFKGEFNLSNGQVSYVIAACFAGSAIFNFVAGIIFEKYGQRASILIGLILFTIGMGMLSISSNYMMLLGGMFLSNTGVAFMSIVINTVVPVLFIGIQAILINITHFTYGAASVLTQRVVGIAIFTGVPWRKVYLITFIASAAILLISLFVKTGTPGEIKRKKGTGMKGVFKNKLLYLYILIFGTYFIAEHGTVNWFVNLLESQYKLDKNGSSIYIALFFGGLTLGRLVGGFVVNRFGHFRTVIVSLSLAFSLYMAGTLMGIEGMILVSASGLFFSIVFPTVISTVGSVFKNAGAFATGIIISAASLIDAVGNALIGNLNDLVGYRAAFYIMPLSLMLCAVFVNMIQRSAFMGRNSIKAESAAGR